jgi:lipid A disaccharide synthetase
MINVKFISLVNLIAGREVVKEMIQSKLILTVFPRSSPYFG